MLKQVDKRRQFLDLLLIADESLAMIEKYIDKGEMYIWKENGVKGGCIVTAESFDVLEIKNLAVYPQFQNQGYGKKIIAAISKKYCGKYKILQIGTGDSPLTIPFYLKCGFKYSYRIKNFFIDNYDHEIYEFGVKLIDMVYLRKNLME